MDEEAKSCLLGVIVGDSGAAVQMTCMLQLLPHIEMAHELRLPSIFSRSTPWKSQPEALNLKMLQCQG